MATTTEPPPTPRSALAGGLAVAARLAVCLLPLAAAGGLIAGLISAGTGAPLPAALLGLAAVGAAGGVVVGGVAATAPQRRPQCVAVQVPATSCSGRSLGSGIDDQAHASLTAG